MNNEYFYSNTECPYYPCHGEGQNCKFCYCPLYFTKCSGDYEILSNGIKDCSRCTLPHTEKGAREIICVLINAFDSFRDKGFPELIDIGDVCHSCPDEEHCGNTACSNYRRRHSHN